MRRRGDEHHARLRRLRDKGHDHRAFRGLGPWLIASLVGLGLTAALPLFVPESRGWLARSTPALALFFFLAAVGWWLRMGKRSFAVAGGFVVLLYAATAWAPFAFDVHDFTVLALLSSFAVFALAGFNLVFILEEITFDVHRELHLAHRAWSLLPSIIIAALVIGLPLLERAGIVELDTLWLAAVIWAFVYIGWWTFRAFVPVREGPVLRELHLLTAGTLAAAGVVELAALLRQDVGVLPSILMYGVLVFSWIYVSYTSLQRAHFLLGANNAVPWLCLLLSASFALLQHASFHYQVEGVRGVQILLEQRIAYLVFGIWVGVGFYVAQSAWRVMRTLRDDARFTARGRILAGNLARVFESLLTTEKRIEGAAVKLYGGMDRILPGHHQAPKMPGLPEAWDVDVEGVTRVESEEE